MRNNWSYFMDSEGGSSNIFPMDPLIPQGFGSHLLSHIASFLHDSKYLYVPGSLALQEAFDSVSKFAGALLIWLASRPNSTIDHRISGDLHCSNPSNYRSKTQVKHSNPSAGIPLIFTKISRFSMKQLCKEAEQLWSFPALSLAAALIPPFDNICRDALAIPLGTGEVETPGCMIQRPCQVENQGCPDLSFGCLTWTSHAVEPRTGIEFPTVLENILAGENTSSFASELLVGTGSRIMKIIRIKSLKVYAFGFYVHPFDVCEKLGPKYASFPVSELNKCRDFYEDLLREDINMTVRLVISCNGIKISTVKDAFEKSLRARLLKTNPDTDYSCLQKFGSIFSHEIPLHVGTTINFRRTADGCLITEIGGNQLGIVQSKELCRAFFDMYIGDIPVCAQTKEEIGKNVASIMRRC